jgi:lipopolysaccharide export LptBFGC system permease protein LptF
MRDLYIESTGQMGYQPSIRASKINIADNNDVSWLYNLTPKTYYNRKRVSPDTNEWKNEAESDLQYGLIAEEVESVNSNICFYDVDESNNKTLAGVTYSQLITPILKAVQDLKSEIHSLQEENKALRIRVTNLEDN